MIQSFKDLNVTVAPYIRAGETLRLIDEFPIEKIQFLTSQAAGTSGFIAFNLQLAL